MTKRERLHAAWTTRQRLHKAAPEGRKRETWGMLHVATMATLEAEIRAEKRGRV